MKHATTMGKVGLGGKDLKGNAADSGPQAPDVSVVVRELGDKFKDLIREISKETAKA